MIKIHFLRSCSFLLSIVWSQPSAHKISTVIWERASLNLQLTWLHWTAKKSQGHLFQFQLVFFLLNKFMKAIFPITTRFSKILWQRSKNQENGLFIGRVYAEVNQQVQGFAFSNCFSRNNLTRTYNFKLKIRSFQKKTLK